MVEKNRLKFNVPHNAHGFSLVFWSINHDGLQYASHKAGLYAGNVGKRISNNIYLK